MASMTEQEKIAMVKTMINDDTADATISTYLIIAGQKLCRSVYPFDDTKTTVPEKYDVLHCEAAAYLLNKRGGEGEITHSENGVSRTYENADLPASMLRQIVPVVGIPQ